MSLLELFCEVDDFCQDFSSWLRSKQLKESRRGPKQRLSSSEIMTIVINFHQEGYRDFKHYYQNHVRQDLAAEFPELVSYNRFVELMHTVLLPLCAYLQLRFGNCTGIAFVDSTPLAVCHNRRIRRHKVFRHLAARGKTTVGWFYGSPVRLSHPHQWSKLIMKDIFNGPNKISKPSRHSRRAHLIFASA